jgi:hypothetical protein
VGHVHVLTSGELNAYDVLVADWVIFTRESLPTVRRADAGAVAEGDAAPRGVERAGGGAGAEGPEASPEAQ